MSIDSEIRELIALIRHEISSVKSMLRDFEVIPTLATKHDLEELFRKIMSLVSDAIAAFAAQVQPDVDTLNNSLASVVTGIQNLDSLIVQLQGQVGGNPDLDQASKDLLAQIATGIHTQALAAAAIPPLELPPTTPVASPSKR
jgi:hypothetical protein